MLANDEGVEPTVIVLSKVPLPLCAWSSVLQETIKQLLYLREQLPAPCDSLRQQAAQDAARVAAPTIPGVRRVRLNTVEKKQIKTVKMINSMLEAASTLPFECTEGGAVSREVALILGNTHTNPREVYLLRFSGSQCPPAADLAKVQGNAVRAVMRTLMMSLSTARSLGPKKMFLFVRGFHGESMRGFSPKPSYQINVRKIRPAIFDLITAPAVSQDAGPSSTPLQSPDCTDDRTSLWFQCSDSVKGLRIL